MTLKAYIRRCLDKGMEVEAAWRTAENDGRWVQWNYVVKIARDWKREQAQKAQKVAERP